MLRLVDADDMLAAALCNIHDENELQQNIEAILLGISQKANAAVNRWQVGQIAPASEMAVYPHRHRLCPYSLIGQIATASQVTARHQSTQIFAKCRLCRPPHWSRQILGG